MSRRTVRPFWLFAFLVVFVLLFNLWLHFGEHTQSSRDDWIYVRLSAGQKEYVDRRGVHVVVGHYLGDSSSAGHPPNLTDEILNGNMFSPVAGEGKDGMPVVIPPHLSGKMRQLYHINKFNLMASDRIPLNRTLPDVRKKKCLGKYTDIAGLPKASIIVVFHNEAWSTLLRTVWSVINRSPRSLLQEIILVDDASTRAFLGKSLDDYVKNITVPIRVLRTGKRVGLIRARLLGARKALGHILVFLDAHCETTKGWLEALVSRVAEDRTRVVCPVIDIISDDTFAYVRSFELHWGAFNWDLHFRWYTMSADQIVKRWKDITDPFRTPAMAGGLFAMDKNYFFEIGAYDEEMEVWGGENLELSFRVWQCGGSVEIAPCSHVGHLFRKSSPYSFPGGVSEVLYGNLARVALVWMDEWKEFFFKFSPVFRFLMNYGMTPEAERMRDRQAVRSRLELRKQLNCKGFRWYLDNVWPQHFFPMEGRFFGKVKHVVEGKCLEKPTGKGTLNQPMGPAVLVECEERPVLRQMFVMSKGTHGFLATDESVCLDTPDSQSQHMPRVKVMACSGQARQEWRYHEENKTLEHVVSGECLMTPRDGSVAKGLVLGACSREPSLQWLMIPVPWS